MVPFCLRTEYAVQILQEKTRTSARPGERHKKMIFLIRSNFVILNFVNEIAFISYTRKIATAHASFVEGVHHSYLDCRVSKKTAINHDQSTRVYKGNGVNRRSKPNRAINNTAVNPAVVMSALRITCRNVNFLP